MIAQHQPAEGLNLVALRAEMATRVGTTLIIMGLVLVALTWPLVPFAAAGSVVVALFLIACGWGARRLVDAHPVLARHFLAWLLPSGLLAAMWWLPQPWIPFLAVPPLLVAALLVTGADAAAALAIVLLAWLLNMTGWREYPLPALILALIFTVVLAWQTVRTLYMALAWADNSQERVRKLLDNARDRQAEQAVLTRSLEQSLASLKRAQAELVAARRHADEARRAKNEFVAKITHELRTPLNVILGFSEMMHLSPETYAPATWSPTLRRDVAQVYRNSRYLLEMIDDILSLSAFDVVEFGLNREPTALEPLLLDSAEYARTLFAAKPVSVECAIDPDLPVLLLDRTRIRQVLFNLINNAQRFTDAGAVCLAAHHSGGEVVISLSDSGSGIPEDQRQHVFEEFYQGDRTLYGRRGGAGLGLAICKQFVEAHGGYIGVESKLGHGSTFFFGLPATTGTVSPNLADGPGTETLLVVDAEPGLATLLRRRLAGWQVIHCTPEGDLRSDVAQHDPRAVICNQAGQNNWNAVMPAGVPWIECSLPGGLWQTQTLAVDGYLPKPVTREALGQALPRILGKVQRTLPNDILVVDDNRSFCLLLERILAADLPGSTVRTAYDLEEARQALAKRMPDLVLLDLDIGGAEGSQLVQELNEAPSKRPAIILVTGASDSERERQERSSQLVVRRGAGLRPAEVIHCLQVLAGVLRPQYEEDERDLSGVSEP